MTFFMNLHDFCKLICAKFKSAAGYVRKFDSKTEKVTSTSPGRGTLTNKCVPKPKGYE